MVSSKYQEYLDSITALNNKIIEEDNSSQELQRRFKAEYDALCRRFDDKIKNFQNIARSSAADYLRTVKQLRTRDLEGIGVNLPDRVRPVRVESLTIQNALIAQKSAESALSSAISQYKKAVERANSTDSELRKALEARRKALQAHPEHKSQPAPEPPKGKKLDFKKYVPYLIAFAIIVFCVFAGASYKETVMGLIAGLVLAVVYLVVKFSFSDS